MTDMEKVIEAVRTECANTTVHAIYLLGSQLNGLAVSDTDYDVVVILAPTEKSILTGQHYASQVDLEQDGVAIDAKVYDTLKLVDMYIKTNPNIVELFYREPVYTSPEFAPVADWFASEEMKRYGLRIGSERFVKSVGGQITQMRKTLANKDIKHQAKAVVQSSKFTRYLREYLHGGILTSVMTPTPLELKTRRRGEELRDFDPNTDAVKAFGLELQVQLDQVDAIVSDYMTRFDAGEFGDRVQTPVDYKKFMHLLTL
jgi:Predicted nucleotidyltransferase